MATQLLAKHVAILLYCVSVLQPVEEQRLLAAALDVAAKLGVSAREDDMQAALREARNDRHLWRVLPSSFSLTLRGEAVLRTFRLNRMRDQSRLFSLRKRAQGR